jgi:ferredoxin
MAKYKIIYDREACIGAFACAAASPDFWLFADDGKADLATATYNKETKKWERIISEEEYDDNQAAAEACPVYVIKIVKVDDDGNEIPSEEEKEE